jgi:hypothetical protein
MTEPSETMSQNKSFFLYVVSLRHFVTVLQQWLSHANYSFRAALLTDLYTFLIAG